MSENENDNNTNGEGEESTNNNAIADGFTTIRTMTVRGAKSNAEELAAQQLMDMSKTTQNYMELHNQTGKEPETGVYAIVEQAGSDKRMLFVLIKDGGKTITTDGEGEDEVALHENGEYEGLNKNSKKVLIVRSTDKDTGVISVQISAIGEGGFELEWTATIDNKDYVFSNTEFGVIKASKQIVIHYTKENTTVSININNSDHAKALNLKAAGRQIAYKKTLEVLNKVEKMKEETEKWEVMTTARIEGIEGLLQTSTDVNQVKTLVKKLGEMQVKTPMEEKEEEAKSKKNDNKRAKTLKPSKENAQSHQHNHGQMAYAQGGRGGGLPPPTYGGMNTGWQQRQRPIQGNNAPTAMLGDMQHGQNWGTQHGRTMTGQNGQGLTSSNQNGGIGIAVNMVRGGATFVRMESETRDVYVSQNSFLSRDDWLNTSRALNMAQQNRGQVRVHVQYITRGMMGAEGHNVTYLSGP